MKEISLSESNKDLLGLLNKIDKFSEFSEQELRSFANVGRLREFEKGEVIIKEGSFDCWVYFLLCGSLLVEKEGKPITQLQRCGDMFGEMGVIDGSPRSATIRARTDTKILAFDASVIDQKLKTKQINFCYIIYRIFAEVLAQRLRGTTEANIKLKEENIALKSRLSLMQSPPSMTTKIPQYKPKTLTNKRALVVDGTESNRKMLKSMLRTLKFEEIIEADDAKNALKFMTEEKIDLVISEWDLPAISGLDFLKKVRSVSSISDTPFILITGRTDKEKISLGIKAKVSQFLIRPFNTNNLHEKINSVIK